MAFDMSSAKPVEAPSNGGFDLSSSVPVEKTVDTMKAPKWARTIAGLPEAGLSMVSGIPGQIAGGLLGLGTLLSGQGLDAAGNAVRNTEQSNFGLGQFNGITDVGKEATQTVGDWFQKPGQIAGDVGAAIGKKLGNEELGRLSGQLPVDVAINFLPLHYGITKPIRAIDSFLNKPDVKTTPAPVKSVLDSLAKQDVPPAPSFDINSAKPLDINLNEGPNTPPVMPVTPEGQAMNPADMMWRDRAQQMQRQQALAQATDQSELPLQNNPQQVAEMQARQTGQPDMFSSPQEQGMVLRGEVPPDTGPINPVTPIDTMAQHELFDQPEQGRVANPYEAALGDWRVDENGIPIKADLSMEANNLENPLQRNLWGDELQQTRNPIGQNANLFDENGMQQGKPLTQAMDEVSQTQAPWDDVLGDQFQNGRGIEPTPALQSAIAAANRMNSGFRGGERGAVPADVLKEGFRGLNRWLSRLTDKPWLRQAFPASHYETNPDGTPLVLLHGTKAAFNDQPRGVSIEGLHAGWATAATLKASMSKDGKLPYRPGNLDFDTAKFTDKNSAVYPITIRKGNYVRLPEDYGSWAPGILAGMDKFQIALAKATGKGYYDTKEILHDWWKDETYKSSTDAEQNQSFAKLLKNQFGVDGFWYPNTFESTKNKLSSYRSLHPNPKRVGRLAEAQKYTDSFVTYDDNNVKSVFDQSAQTPMNSGMARGQRGAVDVNGIYDKLNKLTHKAVDILTPKERIVSGIIGDNSFIKTPDTPESAIARARTEPDGAGLLGGKPRTNFQSGLSQYGDKVNSTMAKHAARVITWAENIATKNVREQVKPVEGAFAKLSRDDLITANEVMKHEQLRRSRFTDEQLQAAGMSPDAMRARQMLRDQFDSVIKQANESRAKLGLDPVTPEAAYYSSQQMGNWHIIGHNVKPGKDGQPVIGYYSRVTTRSEANKAIAWLKKNAPDTLNKADLKFEYKPDVSNTGVPRDVMNTYAKMMEIFQDTPMAAEMKAMLEQYQTEQAFNARGFSNHFLAKGNIPGFIGDRPWLSAKENAVEGVKSQMAYLKEAHRWIPMQEAMSNIKEVLSDPELQKSQPNNMEVTKAYVANALGVNKNMFKDLENEFSKFIGISPVSIGKFVNSLKTTTYLQLIGGSPGYAIATPLQALILGPSFHAKLGVKGNYLKIAVQTLLDSAKILGAHEINNFVNKDVTTAKLSPFIQRALRYAEDNSIINKNMFDEYGNIGEHIFTNLLKTGGGITISGPEKVARTVTFMSFVNHLKDTGMPELEMFRKAGELTDSTLTNFNRSARPLAVGRMGTAGELLYTLKGPLFNTYNSLFEFAHHAQRTGDYRPLATALIMMGVLGGVTQMPLMQEMDGLVNMVKDGVANLHPEWYPALRDVSVKGAMLKYLPDWATYGTVSAATNTQLSSRFSTQITDPSNPLANVAPVAQEVKEWGALAKNIPIVGNPNKTNLAEGLWQNMPPIIKGQMETRNAFGAFQGVKKGDKQSFFNPNNLEDRNDSYDRTPTDISRKQWGLTSLDEAREKDVRYINQQESMRIKTAQESSMRKLIDAAIMGRSEDIPKYAVAFFKNEGDSTQFQQEFNQRILKANLTPEQRQVVKANTLHEVMDVKRRMDMSNAN